MSIDIKGLSRDKVYFMAMANDTCHELAEVTIKILEGVYKDHGIVIIPTIGIDYEIVGVTNKSEEENARLRAYIKHIGDWAYKRHARGSDNAHSALYQVAAMCRDENLLKWMKDNVV